jgi:hypothetical protein
MTPVAALVPVDTSRAILAHTCVILTGVPGSIDRQFFKDPRKQKEFAHALSAVAA